MQLKSQLPVNEGADKIRTATAHEMDVHMRLVQTVFCSQIVREILNECVVKAVQCIPTTYLPVPKPVFTMAKVRSSCHKHTVRTWAAFSTHI
jgi:hypothetical protein